MRLLLGLIILSLVVGLSAPAFAASGQGNADLLIFFSKEKKQLVFKQYTELGGSVDATISTKQGKKYYSATTNEVPGHPNTTITAVGTKEVFKEDGVKVTKYEHRFKSIRHGDEEKKYWWKYELVARYEGSQYYQRWKVDDKVYMMVRYDAKKQVSYVYARDGSHLVLKETVPGPVTLLVRTTNEWFMEAFVDTEL